jgi:amidase
MEDGVLATCEAALTTFADLGVTVEQVPAPFDAGKLWQSWLDLRAFANANRLAPLYANPDWRRQLKATAIWEIETGRKLTLDAVQQASLWRSQWFARAAEMFERFDAVILPTAQVWPFPIAQEYPTQIAGRTMDTYHRWMEVVIPASLIGLPALAVPAGFGAQGLPMGLQLIGRHGGERGLLELAQGWHHAAPWSRRQPGRA